MEIAAFEKLLASKERKFRITAHALIRIISIALILVAFAFTPLAFASSPDELFLDKLEHDSITYFAGEANPANGLIKDSSRPGAPCSVAVVGFGLTALCIGDSRGWIDKKQAYDRVLKTLKTFRDNVPNEHGFFYHFLNMWNASRAWDSEVSSIDTALFLAGALFAGEYYKGTEVETLAKELYDRVDWPWMMNGHKVMCMGWKPKEGFLPFYWSLISLVTASA